MELPEFKKALKSYANNCYSNMEGKDYDEFVYWEKMFASAITIYKGILEQECGRGIFEKLDDFKGE